MFDTIQHRIELNRLGKIIIYLRKSREDMIDGRYASDEETLSRHLGQLQEWALRNLGHEIPEDCIFKEVASGEKIKNRPVFQEVLKKVETEDDIDGILVVNCSRLSRGDLVDCGNIIKIFEITDTLVLTPQKVYNLKDKYDKRFFKDELLRGNDYLEQAKELLYNGRHWSVAQGKFIGHTPPFGYDKVTCKEMGLADGKGFTLKPNENAEYVKMMFDWFLEGIGLYTIATKLTNMGVPSPNGTNAVWDHCKVKRVLKNQTYSGYLTFGKKPTKEKIVDGEVVQYRGVNNDCPIYKGLHKAIVSEEVFKQAEERFKNNAEASFRKDLGLQSPLVGIVKCAVCGRNMIRTPNYEQIAKKRVHHLDKQELLDFLNEHKNKMGYRNVDLVHKLDMPKYHVYSWFGKNPNKFYPSEVFVSKWNDIKKVLNIPNSKWDKIVTEYTDIETKAGLYCPSIKCSNINSRFEDVENLILEKIKQRYEDFTYYLDNYEEEYTKVIKSNKKNVINLDKKIAMVQKQLKNAKIAYEQEVDTLQEYVERKKELNNELELLIQQKESIGKHDEEEKIITIKQAIPILKNVFEDYPKLSVEEKNELLKTIIESVMYLKTEKRNKDSIELDICWRI